METATKIEGMMNEHLSHFNKMFEVSSQHEGHGRRFAASSTSSNVLPPPLYGCRKTHKKEQNGTKGPDMRPVCGAKEAPNSKFSSFLSKIVYDVADTIDQSHECKSSEEMRAGFEYFNKNVDVGTRRKTAIFSMDAKKLYPSLRKFVCKNAVKWLIRKSCFMHSFISNLKLFG